MPLNPVLCVQSMSEAMNEREREKFLEDFGEKGASEADLEAVLALARSTQNRTLRLVVGELRMRRWLCRALLEMIEAKGVEPNNELLKVARFLVGSSNEPS